jgi:hypothetical protein
MRDQWPPKPFDIAASKMREWNAWYVGKAEDLAAHYGNGPVVHSRPSQYRGGLVGAVSRFFWGRPVSPRGQQRTRVHIPLASDLATMSSDLLFAEPPRVRVENSSAQARLDQIINTPQTHSALLEAAEVAAALGGAYMRVVWDGDVRPHAMLDAVDADAAVPEWRWKTLHAVTFWQTVAQSDGAEVLRHLERHEAGRIVHALHLGTEDELGRAVPLTEHPSTAWAAELVDADGAIETGTRRLTATYCPNIRPSREWRSVPALRPLGRSDFDGVEPLLDVLDEVYSSWVRDVRLARARLIVPAGFLQPLGPGQGAMFDDDQEVFTELNMLTGRSESKPITATQFEIRVAEHKATAEQITHDILRAAGYSPSSFGETNGRATGVTATEVVDRRELSETTRDKKSRYWSSALAPITAALLDVDRHVFGTPGVALDEDPAVSFGDQAQADVGDLARTAQALLAAEAASTDVRVRIVHPDWDDDQVDAEVARIFSETGRNVPDPAAWRGPQDGGADGLGTVA